MSHSGKGVVKKGANNADKSSKGILKKERNVKYIEEEEKQRNQSR